jgi:hypothetical protein
MLDHALAQPRRAVTGRVIAHRDYPIKRHVAELFRRLAAVRREVDAQFGHHLDRHRMDTA